MPPVERFLIHSLYLGLCWYLGAANVGYATNYSHTVEDASAFITNRMSQDHVPGIAVALVDS